MATLTRGAIFAHRPAAREVEVPAWGGTIRIKTLSTLERVQVLDLILANQRAVDAYMEDQELPEAERTVAQVEPLETMIVTVIHSVVGDEGERLFTMADYEAVKALDFPTLHAVWLMCEQANAIPTLSFSDQKKSSD